MKSLDRNRKAGLGLAALTAMLGLAALAPSAAQAGHRHGGSYRYGYGGSHVSLGLDIGVDLSFLGCLIPRVYVSAPVYAPPPCAPVYVAPPPPVYYAPAPPVYYAPAPRAYYAPPCAPVYGGCYGGYAVHGDYYGRSSYGRSYCAPPPACRSDRPYYHRGYR